MDKSSRYRTACRDEDHPGWQSKDIVLYHIQKSSTSSFAEYSHALENSEESTNDNTMSLDCHPE